MCYVRSLIWWLFENSKYCKYYSALNKRDKNNKQTDNRQTDGQTDGRTYRQRQTVEKTDITHTQIRQCKIKHTNKRSTPGLPYLMFSMLPFSSLRVEHVLNWTGRKILQSSLTKEPWPKQFFFLLVCQSHRQPLHVQVVASLAFRA